MLNLDNLSQIASLGEALEAVVTLQPMYSSESTIEMKARGELVRRVIPQLIDKSLSDGSIIRPPTIQDLFIQGKDGVGRRSEIPWVRLFSLEHSPRATFGWYVVYLFDAVGNQVYLSLNQGSTQLIENSFVPRPKTEIDAKVSWARNALYKKGILKSHYLETISLKATKSDLGPSYEASNIYSIAYRGADKITDEVLKNDLSDFLKMLAYLYLEDSQDFGNLSFSTVQNYESSVPYDNDEDLLKNDFDNNFRLRSGQGFYLDQEGKKLIENYAMQRAKVYYENLGWSLEDCSSSQPFDYICTKNSERMYLEVKGTTSEGSSIFLTANEVQTMMAYYPNTALFVLSNIELVDDKNGNRIPKSGNIYEVHPWMINQECLKVVNYQYFLSQE